MPVYYLIRVASFQEQLFCAHTYGRIAKTKVWPLSVDRFHIVSVLPSTLCTCMHCAHTYGCIVKTEVWLLSVDWFHVVSVLTNTLCTCVHTYGCLAKTKVWPLLIDQFHVVSVLHNTLCACMHCAHTYGHIVKTEVWPLLVDRFRILFLFFLIWVRNMYVLTSNIFLFCFSGIGLLHNMSVVGALRTVCVSVSQWKYTTHYSRCSTIHR